MVALLFYITKNVLLKPIQTDKDALTYLTTLGYNQNQYNSTSKLPRSRSSSSSIIGVYQKPFGLIGTGQFNKPTKELLTNSRWGNSDTLLALRSSKLTSIIPKSGKKTL
ncbi:unnamed protein product, partial [Rotaria sp. Silwood1]